MPLNQEGDPPLAMASRNTPVSSDRSSVLQLGHPQTPILPIIIKTNECNCEHIRGYNLFLILKVYRLLGVEGKDFRYRMSLEIIFYYSLYVGCLFLKITQLSKVA